MLLNLDTHICSFVILCTLVVVFVFFFVVVVFCLRLYIHYILVFFGGYLCVCVCVCACVCVFLSSSSLRLYILGPLHSCVLVFLVFLCVFSFKIVHTEAIYNSKTVNAELRLDAVC